MQPTFPRDLGEIEKVPGLGCDAAVPEVTDRCPDRMLVAVDDRHTETAAKGLRCVRETNDASADDEHVTGGGSEQSGDHDH